MYHRLRAGCLNNFGFEVVAKDCARITRPRACRNCFLRAVAQPAKCLDVMVGAHFCRARSGQVRIDSRYPWWNVDDGVAALQHPQQLVLARRPRPFARVALAII